MKYFISIFILVTTIACNNSDKNLIVPKNYKQTKNLSNYKGLKIINNTLYLNNNTYNGIVYDLKENSIDTISKIEYINGKLDGVSKKWYHTGQIMEERHFVNGEKHGLQISYWPNGKKRFEYTADKDMYKGELKEWNIDGTLIHLANYKNGQEEGAQKMWYNNGKIRANYVIKNGKRYGLLGTKNCENVTDSIFTIK